MNKQIKLWQSLLSTVIVAALILGGVFFYVGKLRSGVEQLYDGAQQLADGSNQIEDGLSQVNDGTGSLNDGLSQYTNGVAQVDEGLGTLADGLGTYTNGVAQVDNGLGSLQSGLATYTGGVASIKSGTDSALSQAAVPTFATFMGTTDPATLSVLANQITAEAQAGVYDTASVYARGFVLANVFAGNEDEFNRVMGDEHLDTDERAAAKASNEIESYLTKDAVKNVTNIASSKPFASSGVGLTVTDLMAAYVTYAATYQQVVGGGGNANTAFATAVGANSNVQTLLGMAAKNSGYTADAAGIGTLLASGNSVTAAGAVVLGGVYSSSSAITAPVVGEISTNVVSARAKRTFGEASMQSYPKLIAGLAVMYKAIYDVNDGSKQLVAANDQLIGGVKQLKNGTSQLTANNSTIMDGLSQLKDGTGQLVANNDALLSGSSQLSDGSGQLYDGSQTLSDGLATLVDGVHTLLVGVGGN